METGALLSELRQLNCYCPAGWKASKSWKSITQQALTETASGPSTGLSPGFGGAYNLITIIRDQLSAKLCDIK